MSRVVKFLCGVPLDVCTGTKIVCDQFRNKEAKMHGSSEEAFRCMRRYLIAQGYTPVGPREFASPNDGYVRVLTKKSHYGARLRWMNKEKAGNRQLLDRKTAVVARY